MSKVCGLCGKRGIYLVKIPGEDTLTKDTWLCDFCFSYCRAIVIRELQDDGRLE